MRLGNLVPAALLAASTAAWAIPPAGIMHGVVQTQAGTPVSNLFARVTHVEGQWPFDTVTSLTPTGEFVVSPNPGSYLVELLETDHHGAVVDSASVNIFSNVTTYVFFTLHSPDTNADDNVDVEDLVNVITTWGACPGGFEPCPGDTNGDDVVDVGDLVNVIQNWS